MNQLCLNLRFLVVMLTAMIFFGSLQGHTQTPTANQQQYNPNPTGTTTPTHKKCSGFGCKAKQFFYSPTKAVTQGFKKTGNFIASTAKITVASLRQVAVCLIPLFKIGWRMTDIVGRDKFYQMLENPKNAVCLETLRGLSAECTSVTVGLIAAAPFGGVVEKICNSIRNMQQMLDHLLMLNTLKIVYSQIQVLQDINSKLDRLQTPQTYTSWQGDGGQTIAHYE